MLNKTAHEENLEAVEILLIRDTLTEWETQFLEDISVRLESGKLLSEKQQEKLDEIWERIML